MKKTKKWISIRTKLVGIIAPLMALTIIALIILSYMVAKNIILDSSEQMLTTSAFSQQKQIEGWLDANLSAFNAIKANIEQCKPDEETLQNTLNTYYNYDSNYPNGVYIAAADGSIQKASEAALSGSSTDQPWYSQGLSRINLSFGSAYQDADGANKVCASGLLNDGSDEVKVFAAEVGLDRITTIVNSFVEMKNASSVLIDSSNGTILAHRDSDRINTKAADASDAFTKALGERIDTGDLSYCVLHGNMTVCHKIAGTDWVLVSYISEKLVTQDVDALTSNLLILGTVALFVTIILICVIIHIIIKPVTKLTETITSMTSGNFSLTVNTKSRDEIGLMGRSVDEFITYMKSMISEIMSISGTLEQQASESSEVAADMSQVAVNQSASMSDLNITMEQFSASIGDIADNATTLAGVASDTKKESVLVCEKMENTVAVSSRGKQDMLAVGTAMNKICDSIENLQSAINEVGVASSKITDIVSLIGEIADQTNLLSLNASIEAARAGEAGKGFAVVASEISKLAQTSTDSVANITSLIQEVERLVKDAVLQASDSAGEIKQNSDIIQKTTHIFDEIYDTVNESSRGIHNMIAMINEVDTVATNVAAISEEQAASSEEISATSVSMVTQAESIAKNSETVAGDARNLTETSESLMNQVKRFHI